MQLAELTAPYGGLLMLHHLSASDAPGALIDNGTALLRLGVRNLHDAAQYLVRPDGHIAFRCAGRDLASIARYLRRWFGTMEPGYSLALDPGPR